LGERDGFVPVSATARAADASFVVLHPPEGGSLRERLSRALLGSEEGRMLAVGLAHALTRAHRLGAVHGDLRAEAVYFPKDGSPVLLGLGLAPGEPVLPAEDVRSLGALVFESLTGSRPVEGDSLRLRRSDLPRALARAVDRALSTDPTE